MDVEPLTGTPLRGGKKLQLNMFLRKIDQIREYILNKKNLIMFPYRCSSHYTKLWITYTFSCRMVRRRTRVK